MAMKPKTLGKCLRSLQNHENCQEAQNAKEMLRCLRSLQNWKTNDQEAQNAKILSKKIAKP